MNDYLKRFRGRVDRRHVAPATIAVVGVGLVGARIALELARLVPKRLILVDGDDYEEANLSTHPLPAEFIGWNKSVAMAEFLQREVPGIQGVAAIPYYVDPDASDERLIADVIEPATILIVATDRLDVQRHVALLARAAEVPAIVPGVAEDGSRGEAFLSLTDDEPCLACFDGYRPAGSAVRGAAVVALDASPAVHLAFNLALSVLDGDSREAERLLSPLRRGGPVPQLFRAWPPGAPELAHADDGRTEATWREGCPGCGGPPAWAARRPGQEPTRPAPASVPLPDWVTPPRVVWATLGLLLAALILDTASFAVVLVLMLMSLALGFGVWIGREWQGHR